MTKEINVNQEIDGVNTIRKCKDCKCYVLISESKNKPFEKFTCKECKTKYIGG